MNTKNTNFKDSKIAWIGQIPKHWKISKIKYVAKLKTGGTPSNSFGINVENNGYPWITPANIDENFNIKADKFITEKSLKISNFSLFYSNTILLIGIGATVGKIGYLLEKSYCNQQITALVPFNINSKFLLYYLHFIKHKIILEASTNTLPIINNKILNNISVIYPPLNEQKKIAEFLDKKCEIIDKRLSNLERKIKSLKEYKKSLISECVTKGLNSKNMKFKDSQIPWIGQIPKHWEISKIKYYFNFSSGLNITKENLIESGIPVISYGQIHSKENTGTFIKDSFFRFISQDYLKNKKSLVNKGNFIFADTSEDLDGAGNSVFVNLDLTMFAGYHTIILKNKYNFEFSKFLSYLFQTDLWRSQIRLAVSGVKVFSITKKILAKCEILVPPLNEQKEIAEFLDKKCEKIDRLNENYTKQITTLKEYKKSLIYECVTGKKEI